MGLDRDHPSTEDSLPPDIHLLLRCQCFLYLWNPPQDFGPLYCYWLLSTGESGLFDATVLDMFSLRSPLLLPQPLLPPTLPPPTKQHRRRH